MPPERWSLLFPVAEKIVLLVRELHDDRPPSDQRRKEILAHLRNLLADYDHAEVMWMLAQPEPPRPPPPPAKPKPRRYKSHPWYGRASKPKGPT